MTDIYIEKTLPEQLHSNEHLFQTEFWAHLKSQFGWDPFPIKIVYKDTAYTMLVLLRNFGLGLHIGYIPMGPPFPEPCDGKETLLIAIAEELKHFLPQSITFLRFDLPWGRLGKDNLPGPLTPGKMLRKATTDIQPRHTVILRLDRPEEDILASMKHKTRYNIRLSEKKGVKVEECGEEKLGEWFDLYLETAARDRIALHSRDYYFAFFRLAKEYVHEKISVKLLTARVEDELVAGIIMAIKGETAWYMYGASSNNKRNYMPNHALQWEAIRLARENGCRFYDFFGIPRCNEPEDPMYGLYRFKTGFGGDFFHRYGSYDVILNSLYYRGYTVAEKARTFYYKKIKKR
ncbi:MAG: peptidoglycan bridge formation glycyltransferase FemA/FemB family protein [Spirochaetales bacterium]|nr:peptidoglycan bridge formation glycyltransferase FemA/FemB family protein [Spirochaetales bacterium]